MTDEQRKRAAVTICEWLTEYCGQATADYWAWERTPMPCGLPSDEQLDEGLQNALRGATRATP